MAKESKTIIAIGKTEHSVFVGIKPPLNEQEVRALEAAGLIRKAQVESIFKAPRCTLIRYPQGCGVPEEHEARVTEERVESIAGQLKLSRGRIIVDLTPKPLKGSQSSPFNPNTDIKR